MVHNSPTPPQRTRTSSPIQVHERPPPLNRGKTQWMLDQDSKECMVCDRLFNVIHRRHHCRACGLLVCDKCSSKKICVEAYSKSVRVCDNCYKENGGYTNTEDGSQDSQDEKESLRSLPESWMCAFKPFVQSPRRIKIGSIEITIVKAQNLPKMDIIGSSDPYVAVIIGPQIYVQEEEKADARIVDAAKTRTKPNTLNPVWRAAHFVMGVANILDTLRVVVYDEDFKANDDRIGHIDIPLTSLSHQETVETWYDLQLDPEVILKAANAGEEPPKSRIRLKMRLSFSKAGEFFSYYSTIPGPEKSPLEVQVKLLRATFWRLLDLLSPLFWLCGQISDVLSWRNSFKSTMVFLLFIICCLDPWICGLILELVILLHMSWKLAESSTGFASGSLKEIEEEIRLSKISRIKEEIQNDSHLDGMIMAYSTRLLSSRQLRETLTWLQNLLIAICDTLELVYSLLNWKNPSTTQTVIS